MKKLTKEEILLAFPKKIRPKIKLPSLEEIKWQNLDFFSWIHSSGHLGYIVYEFPAGLKGLILNRTIAKSGKGIRMCSLCLTLRTSSGIAFFTTHRLYNKKITHGNYICADLQCSSLVRGGFSGIVQMIYELRNSKFLKELI